MSAQPARWYEVAADGRFHIYDQPYVDRSQSVSIVTELGYYRANFHLRKIWGAVAPAK